ncbi:hypothetical protein EPJ72_11690 [Brachyspira pilosicoli]|uniref:Uncharacterized protein n=1 Tax=Brachyspira pilosicoli TaxID=52584 RepID=A0A5C8EF78_BRAPL|nr:hypothetical protein EPJ72_11690 [Brachyspira pilosicoli]
MWQQKKWGLGQSPRYKNKNINLFLTKYSCLGIYLNKYILSSFAYYRKVINFFVAQKSCKKRECYNLILLQYVLKML